jgi:hypothetical protein
MGTQITTHHSTGKNLYLLIFNDLVEVFRTTDNTFVTYVTANRGDYDIPNDTELGTASGIYPFTIDPDIVAGDYSFAIYERTGGSPAEPPTDVLITMGALSWTGAKLIFTGSPLGIADAVWDEPRGQHTVSGTFGQGTIIAPNGMTILTTTEPIGVPANFQEQLQWLYMRFSNKTEMTATELKTFASDDLTAITTQSLTDDGLTQTLNRVL